MMLAKFNEVVVVRSVAKPDSRRRGTKYRAQRELRNSPRFQPPALHDGPAHPAASSPVTSGEPLDHEQKQAQFGMAVSLGRRMGHFSLEPWEQWGDCV